MVIVGSGHTLYIIGFQDISWLLVTVLMVVTVVTGYYTGFKIYIGYSGNWLQGTILVSRYTLVTLVTLVTGDRGI